MATSWARLTAGDEWVLVLDDSVLLSSRAGSDDGSSPSSLHRCGMTQWIVY